MIELSKAYNPKESEDKWYKNWEDNSVFAAKVNKDKKSYSIVIPPPNVTGILHMGHALNNTIQDILIRYNRMKGMEALWMPGTDHAGIATQNVVERKLAKEGKKRQDLGRDKFIDEVWKWKEEYGSTIIRQLKKLGASCDWDRLRFTMDTEYSESVKEVFIQLFEKGLIYQGNRIINWCPRCQTALSDEEAPHQQLKGHLYFLRYPLKDDPKKFVVVATTRPETMLGDTAVAVNPKDKRYKKIIGQKLILPLVNREITVIADEMVDLKFGTGCVKITPAHDPNDYAAGKKHNLDFINVMYPDARINANGGVYKDLDRFKAREQIIKDLQAKDLLDKIEDYELSAGHCYRCHTIIEPYLSKQWFVKMQPLSIPAVEAVKSGKIKFHPKRWTKVYLNWMENIQDWCISRQIWWGHRIPVYYCKNCQEIMVSRTAPEKCSKCNSKDIFQDPDVLDTWFSSWLWPFATFGWPKKDHKDAKGITKDVNLDLKYFYPTASLVTAPEIIFFWVARMIMAGFEFMGDLPFKDVYIHGTVRDKDGRKMSKSLGNIIDPLEIINEFGTDALRFSLISITSQGQDVYLSKERFEQGRNFANKIWNASRFVLMNLQDDVIAQDLCQFYKNEKLSIANKWILSRLYSTIKELNKYLDSYKFNEAANLLYRFFWHEYCDWYLEIIKPEIKERQTQVVMYKVLEKFLRLIHPFMPFITEEIWHTLNPKADYIILSSWPHIQENIIDKKLEKKFQLTLDIISGIRNMRAELEIVPTQTVDILLAASNKATKELLEQSGTLIKNLARVNNLTIQDQMQKVASCVTSVISDVHIAMSLEGIIDIEKEKQKIDLKIAKTKQDIKSKEGMLANKNFVDRAPSDVVEKERVKLAEFKETLIKLEGVRHALQ